MLSHFEIRRLSRLEVVEYGRKSAKHRTQAAEELYRRHHDHFLKKGMLSASPPEVARQQAEDANTLL